MIGTEWKMLRAITLLASAALAQLTESYFQQEVTWANVLPVLQQSHEERALRSYPGDCDRSLAKSLPFGTIRIVKSIVEFLDLFKTNYQTQEELQGYLDNPGQRSIFIVTYDSASGDTTLNCGIETLLSTLQLRRQEILQGVKTVETVQFDLALMRRALQEETDQFVRESLNRVAGDLNLANQLYYFKNGRYWLYRGSTLLSEGALGQLLMFKDRADRLNMLRLDDLQSIEDFIDFTRPPLYKNFPIKETALRKVLQPFYDDLQLKARVICPVPEEETHQHD